MTCLEVSLLEGKMTKARADVDAMLHKCARSPSSTIEDNSIKGMLDRLSKIVGSRKVRNLKTFYSVPRIEKQGDEVDIRCWEVVFLEDAKNRFKPMNCVFVATEVDKEETAYLEKRGILTESLEETWDSQPGGDCLKDELDMVFIDKCNAVIAEKILRIRWTDKQLKSTIFIYSDFLHGFDEELHALRHLRDHVQVYEDRREHLLELQNGLLVAHQFSDKCPVLPPIPTVFKEAFIPHFLDYEAYPDSYVEMKEFSHVSRNVELIQSHIMQAGFVQDTVLKLENVLNGRQLRRIRIAGLGPFVRAGIDAKQFSGLYRLALILLIKEHFKISEITFQEQDVLPFEKTYLQSLGIITSNVVCLGEPETGLEANEVTFFYTFKLTNAQLNQIHWANRHQARKYVILAQKLKFKNCILKTACWNCRKNVKSFEASFSALSKFLKNQVTETITVPEDASEACDLAFSSLTQIMGYRGDALQGVPDKKPTITVQETVERHMCIGTAIKTWQQRLLPIWQAFVRQCCMFQ